MRRKSEGFASTLFDLKNQFPLSRLCEAQAIPYADVGLPVECKPFTDSGQALAGRSGPGLENHAVIKLPKGSAVF